jgi:hypothetical protein
VIDICAPPLIFPTTYNGIRTKNRPVWITSGAAPIHWMGPIRNPRWEQKRTEGYVIVSTVIFLLWIPLTVAEDKNSILARKRCCHLSDPVLSVRPGSNLPYYKIVSRSNLPYISNTAAEPRNMYSVLKLVNKSINIWPFSYWPCYMALVLIMASDGCNGPRPCLGPLQPSLAIINTSGT